MTALLSDWVTIVAAPASAPRVWFQQLVVAAPLDRRVMATVAAIGLGNVIGTVTEGLAANAYGRVMLAAPGCPVAPANTVPEGVDLFANRCARKISVPSDVGL